VGVGESAGIYQPYPSVLPGVIDTGVTRFVVADITCPTTDKAPWTRQRLAGPRHRCAASAVQVSLGPPGALTKPGKLSLPAAAETRHKQRRERQAEIDWELMQCDKS
jgi:hypothetical protein